MFGSVGMDAMREVVRIVMAQAREQVSVNYPANTFRSIVAESVGQIAPLRLFGKRYRIKKSAKHIDNIINK